MSKVPLEIERKFLVLNHDYKANAQRSLFRQGYLSSHPERTVRVRIAHDKGVLTIKGPTTGASRQEFEYPLPLSDAQSLLMLCEKPIIEKYRYTLEYQGMLWEVDEFLGDNEGLILAEIELPSEDTPFLKPHWIGEEVTGDPRYYNSYLIRNPYKTWRVKSL